MGGVGQEAAEPFLGGSAFGEGHLDLVDHGVEGPPQLAHLGSLGHHGHPLGEIALGDGAGRFGDPDQGLQIAADHEPRQGPQPHQQNGRHDQLDEQQLAQGALLHGQGYGDDHHAGSVGQGLGHGPIGLGAGAGAGGREVEVRPGARSRSRKSGRDVWRRRSGPTGVVEEMGLDHSTGVPELSIGPGRHQHGHLGVVRPSVELPAVEVGALVLRHRTRCGHVGGQPRGRQQVPTDREGRGVELLVDPAHQEGAERVVGHHIRDDQAGGHHGHHQHHEAEPEGHPPGPRQPHRPDKSDVVRMEYPRPRTVRINGGPWTSSFLRR